MTYDESERAARCRVVTALLAKLQAVLLEDAAGGRIIPAVFGLDTVHP